jgi:chitinase
VTISANASDTDGSIAQVDFYQGSTLIGSATSSPYGMTWSNVPAGTYSIVAVARDNGGASTTSGARTITVNGATPSRVTFTASANDSTAVTRYNLDIFTSGANPATDTPVATRDLGKPPIVNGACDVNIASTISALPSGNYIATVTAVGPAGSTRSAASPPFTR